MTKPNSEYVIRQKYEGQPICSDPTAQPKENETGIHFSMGERLAWISTYEPALIEGLVNHKHFKVDQLITMRIKRRECVVGIVGKIPIGALRIGKKRASDRHDLIVGL